MPCAAASRSSWPWWPLPAWPVAKAVPGDGALPVVELMPLTMKHEVDLKLSADQIKSLEDYRKQAAPGRMAVQKKIIELRGQLRMAILDNRPAGRP